MTKAQWLMASIMALVLIAIGGLREIVFVNINEQIFFNEGHIDQYRVLDSFSFLKNCENADLVQLKWILTLLFALVLLSLAILTFRYILKDKAGAKWMLILYGAGTIVAGAILIGSKLLGDPQSGYTLSRVIMGALQSPFPLMLMIPARMLAKGYE